MPDPTPATPESDRHDEAMRDLDGLDTHATVEASCVICAGRRDAIAAYITAIEAERDAAVRERALLRNVAHAALNPDLPLQVCGGSAWDALAAALIRLEAFDHE